MILHTCSTGYDVGQQSFCIPVVQDLRYLTTQVVGAIHAQGAGREGEGCAVRTLDLGHAPITVVGAIACVLQLQGILRSFLHRHSEYL